MDTDSIVYEIEIEDFYKVIAKDTETKFDTNRYSKNDNRPLPIVKNEKIIEMMKDELGGYIMAEFVALREKMYVYTKLEKKLNDKDVKDTKKSVVVESLTFEDCKICLFDCKTIYRGQILFERKKNEVYNNK